MAGGIHVLEKMQGERLVEQHGAHQRPALFGRKLFPVEPAQRGFQIAGQAGRPLLAAGRQVVVLEFDRDGA